MTHITTTGDGNVEQPVIADVTGLQTALDGKAASAHVHQGTDITSGTIDGDRLPAMSTTKKGAVPATGTPSGKVLDDYGSWVTNGSSYTLPKASDTVLGGIKVGTNLSIDGNGVLSASGSGGSTTGLYSGTLDFGSIPDGGCAELTFAATGAVAGNVYAISLPSGLDASVIGNARASATDTIAVRLCNFSGAAVNPASSTLKVRDLSSLGYLTASATIDYGAISDGGCASNTITVTGAATGDNVAAGWPSGLESGLVGSMRVTSADTVTAWLCNWSGAAVDPASGTFKVGITK
jgi:hypothetical protein